MVWYLVKYRDNFTLALPLAMEPAGAGNFPLHHRIQNGSGDHPASYTMGTRGSFLGGKAAGV
jgi:hypothetical protein